MLTEKFYLSFQGIFPRIDTIWGKKERLSLTHRSLYAALQHRRTMFWGPFTPTYRSKTGQQPAQTSSYQKLRY